MRVAGWELKTARNLLTGILRNPGVDDASCLAFVAGFISIFLLQVEPLLWHQGIFRVLETYEGRWPSELNLFSGFWLYPFEWLAPPLKDGLWLPAAIVYLCNAVLLDRFVSRNSGDDVSFLPWTLHLRRLLAGIPVLGLCVIPLWRVLCNRKPKWAYRRTAPRLVLGGFHEEPSGAVRRLPHSGRGLHSGVFLLWILISNLFALRAAVAWLNEPERTTAASLLAVQGICGALRLGGILCFVAYVRLRSGEGALRGKKKWGLLICSGAWLLPQSLFLLAMAALMLLGEGWGTMMSIGIRSQSRLEREANEAIDDKIFAVGRPLQTVALDRATFQVLRLYREKTFLLMMEVASVMMLILPMRERLPLLNLPGCLMMLLCLVALLSLPVGAILFGRSLLHLLSGSREKARNQVGQPFARYILLTALAVVGGFNIGALAGLRKVSELGFFFFWIGAFGSGIGLLAAVWGEQKTNEKSLMLWPMLFLCIGMEGYQMQQGSLDINLLGVSRHIENAAQFHLFKLYLTIPLIFILTFLVGLYRGRWLPRPFRVKDIFNPSLPLELRGQLALLVVTACLPLGGLLVPVWIRLRARLAERPLLF